MLTSSRLFAKKFNFNKSSSIKQTIYQKLDNSNGNTFSFISHECSFSYHPRIVASKIGVQQLFSAKIKDGQETQPQKHQHPCPILLDLHHPSLNVFKNHEKSDVDKKTQACKARRALYLSRADAQCSQYLVYWL